MLSSVLDRTLSVSIKWHPHFNIQSIQEQGDKVKRVLFIGNRANVFDSISKFDDLELVLTLALHGSFLHEALESTDIEHNLFTVKDRQKVFDRIAQERFDILISNGCPFIIPVSKIKSPHQLFINIHPSLLPDLRGGSPINGALFFNRKIVGATMHHMDNGIDTGNIIYQGDVTLTDDLDLGLLYCVAFDLEAKVFSIGMNKLIETDFDYQGEHQTKAGFYYTRSEQDMLIDFRIMPDAEIMTRVRAFGIRSQGVSCTIGNESYEIFDAEIIFNDYLLDKYASYPSGALLLAYDDKLLVKTRDGIIKVKSYEKT